MAKEDNEKLAYISLQEASDLCDYSQEYLSLRARQGKLKSVKFGRNWITTKDWLVEYVKKSEKHNAANSGKITQKASLMEEKTLSQVDPYNFFQAPEVKKIKIIKIPNNLPIEKEPRQPLEFVAILAVIIIFVCGILNHEVLLGNTVKRISYFPQEILENFNEKKIYLKSEIATADLRGKIIKTNKFILNETKFHLARLKKQIILLVGSFSNKPIGKEDNTDLEKVLFLLNSSQENNLNALVFDKNGVLIGGQNKELITGLASLNVAMGNEGSLELNEITIGQGNFKQIEMMDIITNEPYCVWISNGEWAKAKGKCRDVSSSLIVPNSLDVESFQEKAINSTSTDQARPREVSE